MVNNKMKNILPLEVVALEDIFLHENVDPPRVEKLVKRLTADGKLSNPPIVMPLDHQYVVLDGATRTTALKEMGYPHAIVQVVTNEDKLELLTWSHFIRQLDSSQVVKMLANLPEISLVEIGSLDETNGHDRLCYLQTVEGQIFLVKANPTVNSAVALNKLTETYINTGFMTRTLDSNFQQVKQKYPDITALIVFPKYTVAQVLQVAQSGQRLPAGITRFIIPGRVLRVNADLVYLKSARPLSEKQRWLADLLADKRDNGRIRYYAEPVYLLDE